jgi:hypothetical protein
MMKGKVIIPGKENDEAVVSWGSCIVRQLYREAVVPWGSCIVRQLYREAVVSWGSCIVRQLYREAVVPWGSCIVRQLYREAVVSWGSCIIFKVSINLARKNKRKILPNSIFSTGFIRHYTEKLNSTYIMACVVPSTTGRNIFLHAET